MRTLNQLFVYTLITGLMTVYMPNAFADQQPTYANAVGNKALNAFSNLTLGVVEIPKNIINTTNNSNIIYGAVGGLFKGMVHTGGRIGVGMIDLVTFPLPTKPLTQPEYVWDSFSVDTTYGPVFRLKDTHQVTSPSAVAPSAQAVTPSVAEPKPLPIDNSKQYNVETNRKLDTVFKNEMSK